MWDAVKSIVGVVAPTIGTALGGPVGGMAAKVLTSALGIDEGSSPKQIEKALQANPEALVDLKKAEMDFDARMKELDIDVYELDQKDRDSARQREIQTKDSWTPRLIAFVVISGFFATVGMVMGGYVKNITDPLLAGLIGTLIGYVSAKADQVVSYYFGSSSGSKSKTDALAQAAKR